MSMKQKRSGFCVTPLFKILIDCESEGFKKFIPVILLLVEHDDKREIPAMMNEKAGITEYVSESAALYIAVSFETQKICVGSKIFHRLE